MLSLNQSTLEGDDDSVARRRLLPPPPPRGPKRPFTHSAGPPKPRTELEEESLSSYIDFCWCLNKFSSEYSSSSSSSSSITLGDVVVVVSSLLFLLRFLRSLPSKKVLPGDSHCQRRKAKPSIGESHLSVSYLAEYKQNYKYVQCNTI